MIRQMMLAAAALATFGGAAAAVAQDRPDDRDRGAMHDDRGPGDRGDRDMRHDYGRHRGEMMRYHHHHRHWHHRHGYYR